MSNLTERRSLAFQSLDNRIAELKAENERLHRWIDSYCGQPDQTKIVSEFERRINRAEAALREIGELVSDIENHWHATGDFIDYKPLSEINIACQFRAILDKYQKENGSE